LNKSVGQHDIRKISFESKIAMKGFEMSKVFCGIVYVTVLSVSCVWGLSASLSGTDIVDDCDLWFSYPDQSRGAQTTWETRQQNPDRDLLRCRLDGLSDPWAIKEISSVTVHYQEVGNPTASNSYDVYALKSANFNWVENGYAGGISGAPNSGACWNYQVYNTLAWAGSAGASTAGTDYYAPALYSDTYTSGSVPVWKSFTVTDSTILALWRDYESIELLYRTSGFGNSNLIYSSEAGVNGPYFDIQYTIYPEPNTALLMVLGSIAGILRRKRHNS
jgi:hypothetical protein